MRIIAAVVTQGAKVVQSFGYHRLLPLGSLDVTLNNLERWGVEEIIIKNISRSELDFVDIENALRRSDLTTPLTYGGNINSLEKIDRLLKCGVERFCFDKAIVHFKRFKPFLSQMLAFIGRQALVANLNIGIDEAGKLYLYDYEERCKAYNLNSEFLIELGEIFSDIIINDYRADGERSTHNLDIFSKIDFPIGSNCVNYLISGGVGINDSPSSYKNIKSLDGVVLGNTLYRKENSLQKWCKYD